MIDLSRLNESQRQVVTDGDGYALVLAGAGTGKTNTIVHRVAYLLQSGVAPDEILLLTFTNKAAAEMVERLYALTGVRLSYAGTFHKICHRFLRVYGQSAGVSDNFVIFDSDESEQIMKRALKSIGVETRARKFPSSGILRSITSFAKNSELTIAEVIDKKFPHFEYLESEISQVINQYEKFKSFDGGVDFDDLITLTLRALRRDREFATRLSGRFKAVLVDEFQDTNIVQSELCELLSKESGNLLVVGDDAQSIYSFRAANIENIMSFSARHSGAKVFSLTENYRSTPEILELANAVIASNSRQYKKDLVAANQGFSRPELISVEDERAEARLVAERIDELLGEGIKPSEIAVLFRASSHSQALEVELSRRRHAYEYRGGVRFFERSHIKDALAFLRLVANPSDYSAWRRALLLFQGIGPAALEKFISTLATIPSRDGYESIAALNDLFTARARIGFGEFLAVYRRLKDGDISRPSEMIFSLLESPYREYLEREYPDFEDRIDDLEALARSASSLNSLVDFLAESALDERFTGELGTALPKDRLTLSTIHQAKGLEWKAVFIIRVAAGGFPSERAVAEADGLEEERRLFYVAVTRAKKYLMITYPLLSGARGILLGPSLFLTELPRGLFAAGDTGIADLTELNDNEAGVFYEDESSSERRSFLSGLDEL